jgi:hypothetical protein
VLRAGRIARRGQEPASENLGAGQLEDWTVAQKKAVTIPCAIQLDSLGREDLLHSKLSALCDCALDLGDCVAFTRSKEELATIVSWLGKQDGNPDWPAYVRETLGDLEQQLRDGV